MCSETDGSAFVFSADRRPLIPHWGFVTSECGTTCACVLQLKLCVPVFRVMGAGGGCHPVTPVTRPLTPCRHGRSGLSTQCKHLYFFWACVLVVCMWFSLCYTPAHPAGWGVFSPRVDACGCSRLQRRRLKEAVWLFVFSWGAIACHTLWYHDVAELFTDFTTKD